MSSAAPRTSLAPTTRPDSVAGAPMARRTPERRPRSACYDAPMSDSDAANPAATAALFRRAFVTAFLLVGSAFLTTTVAYARYGGPWVDRLETAVGEVMGARAVALARAGRTEEAIDAYRQALAAKFDNPELYKWRAGELATLLTGQARYDEALDAAVDLLDHDVGAAMAAFREIHDAVQKAALHDVGLQLSERFAQAAHERAARRAEALGWLHAGLSLRDLDRPAEAAEHALRAFALAPSLETACVGSRVLRDARRLGQGVELVRYFLEHADTDDLRREARAMAARFPELRNKGVAE